MTPDDLQPYVLTPSRKRMKMRRNMPRYMRRAGSQSACPLVKIAAKTEKRI